LRESSIDAVASSVINCVAGTLIYFAALPISAARFVPLASACNHHRLYDEFLGILTLQSCIEGSLILLNENAFAMKRCM